MNNQTLLPCTSTLHNDKAQSNKTLAALLSTLLCSTFFSFNCLAVNYSAGSSVENSFLNQPLNVVISARHGDWILAIDNQLLSPLEAKISPYEKSFARKVSTLLANNQYPEIATLFDARAIENDSEALLLLRGQVLLLLKRSDEAEKAFILALDKMPDLIKAHQGLSLLYMQQHDYKSAQLHLIRSIELGQADEQIYAQLAFIHVKNHQPWSAIAAYRQALMLSPGESQYQQGLLFALIAAGDLSQASALLDELINKQPDNPQLWLQRGQIALKKSDNVQALVSIEIALKLNPKDTSNQLLAAQLHLTQGSSERAVFLVEESVEQYSKQYLQQVNNNSNTADMLKTQPKIANVMLQTLAWLVAEQQWGIASDFISTLERGLSTKVENDIAALFFNKAQAAQFSVYTAQLSLQDGNVKKAMASLNNALEVDPTLGDALLSLANLYKQQQQFTQARLMYVRAEALPEYQLSAWLGLAQIEIDSTNYKSALVLLKKALRSQPSRQDLIVNIRALEKLIHHEG
jgi:tetratricopeptide (TPR) repeat protein